MADRKHMSDSELVSLIDKELSQAIGADDYTASQRAKAMEYYHGEAEGDLAPPSVPNRSKVVSKDLMDTVEWAMPSLMDIFASADDIVKFEPDSPEDEQACQDATNYIGYLIHRRNEGFITLHDAIKQCLIARMSVVKVYADRRWEHRQETYNGLLETEVAALGDDPDIEIVEQREGEPVMAPGPDGQPMPLPTFDVVVQRRSERLEFVGEGVPPEEIRIAKDTRVISDTRFIAHEREVTISDLVSLGYDQDLIDALQDHEEDSGSEDELARHDYDGSHYDGDEGDESQRKITLTEAYIRVDYDRDGIAEYRRVVKARGIVFENDITDDHPFALFTPILMPYKVIGLGFWDLVEDLQRIKTALTRQVLDNVYLSNNPITDVVEGQVNLDDVLQPRPGGIRRVKSLDAIRTGSVPFVAGAGLQLLKEVDQIRDTRTGVTELNSAVNVESLAKGNVGSEGVQALMNQGAQRLRLIARVLAETGIKRMYYLMLKLVTQHQDRPQQVKINGRWMQIDPREWKTRYRMEISVGVGTFGRQQQIANLALIGQAQEKLMPLGLVTPANVYNTAKRLGEAMGYRDAEQFFTAPQEGQPPPQGEDQGSPEAQAIVAAEQIRAQASLEKAKMDNETRMKIAQAEIESKERVAMWEAQQRVALEREKLAAKAVYG